MSSTTTVRIPRAARDKLKEAADHFGITLTELITELAEEVQTKGFFAQLRDAYDKAKNNPQAVKDEAANLAILDGSLADGLGEHLHDKASARGSMDGAVCRT